MVAGEQRGTDLLPSGDDHPQVGFHAGFIVRFSELLVEESWGNPLGLLEVAPGGVVVGAAYNSSGMPSDRSLPDLVEEPPGDFDRRPFRLSQQRIELLVFRSGEFLLLDL